MSTAAALAVQSLADLRGRLAERVEAPGGPAGQAWRDVPVSIRTALCMLSVDLACDARDFAMRPWGSYTDQQRLQLGATARQFAAALSSAAMLR